ncbi:MAG: cell division protein FtsI [Cutibacterium acnes]|uniref:peptidoglycan D,D-transpeptidase FtsI family protein n=1 Tax=Cutibacterium sp. TaxID=1912221 RepID=UPI000DB89165|nr:penicillin-binding transpeptidase domain-containing protein [Cutibacterium sp.]MCA3759770.1 penicillin-binding protein 2 [Cutibacterium sp.]PZQ76506.1 MAG: cell division protein FtsI [Cutibacterium acnes]
MNRQIRAVSLLAGLMFLALMVNLTGSAMFRQASLNNDPHNVRVRDAEFSQNRGNILVGSRPIATTTSSNGKFAYQRVYLSGPKYAPITGYYSYYYGRSMLEQTQNAQLTGTSDAQWLSRITGTLSGHKPEGGSITTTINAKAQDAAWDGLKGKKGAVVALDYTTGAVLAMASSPSYDPNELASHHLNDTTRAWKNLVADPSSPLTNRATREIYPPGSTFKLVTAAAALQNGYHPNSMVDSPENWILPGTRTPLTNETNCGGSRITLAHALDISCNTAFGKVGVSLGQDKIRDQAERFGFGKVVNSDVSSVASRFPQNLTDAQLAQSSIGQFDVAASPLQMAMVTAGIANDGKLMTPYLTAQVRASNLQVVSEHHPKQMSQPMTKESAEQLKAMMVSVVNNGTGKRARINGTTVGGKTGTAQTVKGKAPYAWFVGWSDNPHVAVAVFIQSSDTAINEVSGGRLAAPIARDVIEAMR